MKYYEKERRQVEAEQFVAGTANSGDDKEILGMRGIIHGVGPNRTFRTWDAAGRTIKARTGEWLVRNAEGQVAVLSDEIFQATYETAKAVKAAEAVEAAKTKGEAQTSRKE